METTVNDALPTWLELLFIREPDQRFCARSETLPPGPRAGPHFADDDAERVLIGEEGDLACLPLFGRHEVGGSLPGVFAGTLLTFIPATGDFINAELLGTRDTTMIGNVIQSKFLEITDYPAAAALSFTLMAAILVLILVYTRALGADRLTG